MTSPQERPRAIVTHDRYGCAIRIEGGTPETRYLPPQEIVHVNRPGPFRRVRDRLRAIWENIEEIMEVAP